MPTTSMTTLLRAVGLGRRPDGPGAMVAGQLRSRGVDDPRVLEAMAAVPRDLFVPELQRSLAWTDRALPAEEGQTISQPYIVGLMTSLLSPPAGGRILEVGTGTGYQAAVLSRMTGRVISVEIRPRLADGAAARLADLGIANVEVHTTDGFDGWPAGAPYDGILVTCACRHVPGPLVDQLKPGARLVLPVGRSLDYQDLVVVTRRHDGGTDERRTIGVVFVPMTGAHAFGSEA